MNKKFRKPLLVLAAGLVLVLASTAGATRAAVVYQDSAKQGDFSTSKVSVDVLEGSNNSDSKSISGQGVLEFPAIGDTVKIGQKYDEYVDVVNDSQKYSEYVRVKVRKYWVNEVNGELVKDTSLDPALINLDIDESVWMKNDAEHTTEQDVYYLSYPLDNGDNSTVRLIKGLTISDEVTRFVKTEDALSDSGIAISGTIQNKYLYDYANFYVELEVDAVQTHNAEDAILGAWGVHATFNGTNITAIK